jgi:transcriptional regulator with XRE-family HTH domain
MRPKFTFISSVANQPLRNYLRTYRRRCGLSQDEIAQLLGTSSGTKVSRYENFARLPSVAGIFRYEIIFNQPASKLFAGAYDAAHKTVRARAKRLAKTLAAQAGNRQTARKLALLNAIVDSKSGATGHH